MCTNPAPLDRGAGASAVALRAIVIQSVTIEKISEEKFVIIKLNYLKHPEWRRQQRWRTAIWRNLNRIGLTGVHALPMSRRWVDIQRRRMPLVGLDPAMVGFRLVQISAVEIVSL